MELEVLFAASEAVPFCKTGGLADVAGALAGEVAARGHRVSLWLPFYRRVREYGAPVREVPGRLAVPIAGRSVEGRLLRADAGPVAVYLVDCPAYFDRPQLYVEGGKDYPDNAERFAFFCRAVLEGCRLVGVRPDVVHAHDWQAGLLPVYLRALYRGDPDLGRAATVFTIHNIAYQGLFPREALGAAGLPDSLFSMDGLEFYGQVGYLKGALQAAHVLTTVSPTYAREIQASPEFGRGLEGVLRGRGADLYGLLNGLDVGIWDPRRDSHLPRRYGPGDAGEGKAACKAQLRRECGLAERPGPLLGVVSRLDHQKGLDLVIEAVPDILKKGGQLVVLGAGDPELEKAFARLAGRHPREISYRSGFDDPFAHRIYAASDLFLMPSRFEPCGLGQMIAMRYGSVPVVARTGGLADTVSERGARPNGFVADSAPDFVAALGRALTAFTDRAGWEERRRAGMETDFSWGRSVDGYLELYAKARARSADALSA